MIRRGNYALTIVASVLAATFAFPIAASADVINTYAGSGAIGYSGDSGPATQASLNFPDVAAMDNAGNLYIADSNNHRIRKVDANGVITTAAGSSSGGFSGDGGPATQARLFYPRGVTIDGGGNLFIADTNNQRVRKVDVNGVITTVAGGGSPVDELGDGGSATEAMLIGPLRVSFDNFGSFYISDGGHRRIRKVDVNGIITTVAGNGVLGFSGDGGPAAQASFNMLHGVTVDSFGNIFVADSDNCRVRKVDVNGIITTVAGNGGWGFSGDGGLATEATLDRPKDVKMDSIGNLYIADTYNHRIRKVDVNGIITTVVGNGTWGFFGDGGPATEASLYLPWGFTFGNNGDLFVADSANQRIRRVRPVPTVISTDPLDGALGVPLTQLIRVTFSEDIQLVPPESNIILLDEKRLAPVGKTLTITGNVLQIVPSILKKNTLYSVTIPAFSIRNMTGNLMESDSVFFFTTVNR